MRIKFISVALLFFCLESAKAEDINVKIAHLYTYSGSHIDGDVAIRITGESSECPGGFFVKNSDSNSYKNMVSFLLSAYHAKSKIRLIASPAPWPGSGAVWCQVNTVGFVP